MICGIVVGSQFPGHGVLVSLIATGCFCLLFFHRKQTALFFPLILFFSLGYLAIQPWTAPRYAANHIIHYADSYRWDVVGTIDNQPHQTNNRARFVLQVESLAYNGQTRAATGKLRVTAVGDLPDIKVGDKIQFNARIRSISNFNNPGGFDYEKYMAFKGIAATAYTKSDEIAVIERQPIAFFGRVLNDARKRFDLLTDQSGSVEAHNSMI